MKKKLVIFSAIFAASCFSFTSCNKVASVINAITVDWTTTDVDFTIPLVTDVTAQHSIGGGSYSYNLDSLIKAKSANQLALANIDEVHLTKCVVTLHNSDATNNIANFESASATFSTSNKTDVADIGSVSIPDVQASSIEIPVNSSVNLRPYVAASGTTTFNYNVNGKARRVTTHELTATVHVEYSIHVKP